MKHTQKKSHTQNPSSNETLKAHYKVCHFLSSCQIFLPSQTRPFIRANPREQAESRSHEKIESRVCILVHISKWTSLNVHKMVSLSSWPKLPKNECEKSAIMFYLFIYSNLNYCMFIDIFLHNFPLNWITVSNLDASSFFPEWISFWDEFG